MRTSRLASLLYRAVVVLAAALSFLWLASRSRPPAGVAGVQPLLFGSGLHQPRSLAFADDGALIVAEAGSADRALPGAPGRLVRLSSAGELSVLVDNLPAASGDQLLFAQSGPSTVTPAAAAVGGGTLVFLGPDGDDRLGRLTRLVERGGEWALDPVTRIDEALGGGVTTRGAVWGAATARDGVVYAALPLANQLIRIPFASGSQTAAVTGASVTGFVDSGQRNPLPSGAAVAPDGSIYVALFGPQPFRSGAGRVVRVETDGRWRPTYEGFNFPTALAFSPDGQLYVLEFAAGFDEQLGQFRPRSGRLLSVGPGAGRRRTVVRDVHLPTSLTFSPAGDVYFTESVTPGDTANGNVLRVPAQTLRSFR